jgi:hypothetical protein
MFFFGKPGVSFCTTPVEEGVNLVVIRQRNLLPPASGRQLRQLGARQLINQFCLYVGFTWTTVRWRGIDDSAPSVPVRSEHSKYDLNRKGMVNHVI